MYTLEPGYRIFECGECNIIWMISSRDYRTPSGEDCPDCGEWMDNPVRCFSDSSLKTDNSGNLNRECYISKAVSFEYIEQYVKARKAELKGME